MTNEFIDDYLTPAPQLKNHIEKCIEKDLIQGGLADAWKETAAEKKAMKDLLRQAEGGNKESMRLVARAYTKGLNGFKVDSTLGWQWLKQAHRAGSVKATGSLGWTYAQGEHGEQNIKLGVAYISIAAAQGYDFAAFLLGFGLATGQFGLPINKFEAIRWLQTSLSPDCSKKHRDDDEVDAQTMEDRARELLRELLADCEN